MIIRLIILLEVYLGFFVIMNHKLHIRAEFIPAIITCSISSAMLFAGYLNIFVVFIIIITTFGIAGFIYAIVKKIYKDISKRDWIIISLWMIVVIYFAILLRGSHFTHYDDFTHWATVVKAMLTRNRMPNFRDYLISFQAYPLGSSVFIYYVCRIIGKADSCYSIGQTIISLSFLLPLSVFINKKNWKNVVVILPFFCFALVCNIQIYDLLVDTIMPLAGICIYCIISYYRLHKIESKRELLQLSLVLAPIFIFLINVKNSGIFFCCINWVYLLYLRKQLKSDIKLKTKDINICFYDIAIPLFSLYLWKKHVDIVFKAGNTSKHSMSLRYFYSIVKEKSNKEIGEICRKLINKVFDVNSVSTTIMIVITVLIIVLIIIHLVYQKRKVAIIAFRKLIEVHFIFWVYLFFVFLMYVFSMPESEAIDIRGFDRYMLSIVLLIFGNTIVLILSQSEVNNTSFGSLVLFIVASFSLMPVKWNLNTLYKKQDYESTDRYIFQEIIEEYNVANELSYLILTDEDEFNYLTRICEYDLWSPSVVQWNSSENELTEEFLKFADEYYYIIVFNPSEGTDEFLKQAGLNQYAISERLVINLKA